MTESEAKTKWCPFVRQSATFKDGFGLSYNRSAVENAPECRCIGSNCMVWRWSVMRDGHGFCGLSGSRND
jgi:hypothetical protein